MAEVSGGGCGGIESEVISVRRDRNVILTQK